MDLTITAKQIGKKHALIDKTVIDIEDIGMQPTVHALIEAVVKQQVAAYSSRANGKSLLPFLENDNIDDQAATGKVGFNAIYSDPRPDVDQSIQTAIQAFEDGLFVIFADDIQHTLSQDTVSLSTGTVITFVRLTFLAGSYW